MSTPLPGPPFIRRLICCCCCCCWSCYSCCCCCCCCCLLSFVWPARGGPALQQGFRLRPPFIRLFESVTAAPGCMDDIRFSGDHHNPQRISSRSSNWDDWDQCVNAYFFLFLCICFVNKLKDDYICICVCVFRLSVVFLVWIFFYARANKLTDT